MYSLINKLHIPQKRKDYIEVTRYSLMRKYAGGLAAITLAALTSCRSNYPQTEKAPVNRQAEDYLPRQEVEALLSDADKGIRYGIVPNISVGPYKGYAYRLDRDPSNRKNTLVTIFGEGKVVLDNNGVQPMLVVSVDEDPAKDNIRSQVLLHYDQEEVRRRAGYQE